MEVREAFATVLQMKLSDAELEACVAKMDQDVDGSVTFQEFRKYFKHTKKRKEEILKRREGTDHQ